MKLIIEISNAMYKNVQDGMYCGTLYDELRKGIPLDQLRSDIAGLEQNYRAYADYVRASVVSRIIKIIDGYGENKKCCLNREEGD